MAVMFRELAVRTLTIGVRRVVEAGPVWITVSMLPLKRDDRRKGGRRAWRLMVVSFLRNRGRLLRRERRSHSDRDTRAVHRHLLAVSGSRRRRRRRNSSSRSSEPPSRIESKPQPEWRLARAEALLMCGAEAITAERRSRLAAFLAGAMANAAAAVASMRK